MVAVPSVRVGDPITHDRLSVFPLFLESPVPVSYRLADDALADGTAVVEELSEGGSVPQLAVRNLNDLMVLFLEGQELRGAKQNRVLNTSVLVAAKTQTVLPVSCVEQGRWRHVSKTFSSSDTHCSPKMRSVLKGSVSRSTRSGGGHSSDQGAVWNEVSRQMSSLKAVSPTMAMADTMSAKKPEMDRAVAEVKYVEGAAGLVVAVGGKVVAVDLFDAPETCRKLWPQLVSGVALDALEEKEGTAPQSSDVVAALDALRAGPWQSVPPAGAGEEQRAEIAGRWHGSLLSLDGNLVHGSVVTA
ncbi:MAG: hypothetical protein C0467_01495 [Planctomycetaceae bacterium]|nr:hypothetical protein [Planctomycetaceae bacterium]